MLYKVIEDKKFEYRAIEVTIFDINHNQLDSKLDGYDGWEAFSINQISKEKFLIFLKRSYIEVNKDK